MTQQLPEVMEIEKTIPNRIGGSVLGGDSYVDEQGRWIVELHVSDGESRRLLHVVEGESVEFAGMTWRVTDVVEPTTATRGQVATLRRVGEGGGGG